MKELEAALREITTVGFVVLAAITFLQWRRDRLASMGYLFGVMGGMAVVAVTVTLNGGQQSQILVDVTVAAFLAAGLCVAMFRSCFVPLSHGARAAQFAGAAILLLLTVIQSVVAEVGSTHDPQFSPVLALALIAYWTVVIAEPVWTIWRAGRHAPRLQRARMRALSLGIAGIVAVLLLSSAGSTGPHSAVGLIAILMAVTLIPLLYVAFLPPRWLRDMWRRPEWQAMSSGFEHLLMSSDSQGAMAQVGLSWAMRLVGATSGYIVDGAGAELAAQPGDARTRVRALMPTIPTGAAASSTIPLTDGNTAIRIRMERDTGEGELVVTSGPFTPLFGRDDVSVLSAYCVSLLLGLERARTAERLVAVEKTKTEFLNLASHELRGPLTVIRGYLSMLETGILGELSPEAERLLHTIIPVMSRKGREMNVLIEQMLEAARLEENRLSLDMSECDLRELVKGVATDVEERIDDRHSLEVMMGEDRIPVFVDPTRVTTMISNLIDNALKYSPDGGPVTCAVEDAGGLGLVRVTDCGVGISEDDRKRLFTRFGRIVTNSTAHIPGTGLGLYICRELARAHGGDIVVEASSEEGSTFTLTLPMGSADTDAITA